MRFLLMHKIDESRPESYDPSPEFLGRLGDFMAEIGKSGILLEAEGVQHSATGARIRHSGGKSTITDGPFTEAREVIGGFAIVDVRSREEAVEWAARYAAIFEEVEVEVRQISEFDDPIDGAAG